MTFVGITASLILGSCGIGGEQASMGASADSEPSDARSVEISAEATMPDLIGLDAPEAEEILSELNVQIDRQEDPAPEDAGTVVEQEPFPGQPLEDTVTIIVAGEPPAVPGVTGETFAEARQELEELGFSVEERTVIDESASDGQIVAQDPGAGAENRSSVTLDVARSPLAAYFSDMEVLNDYGSLSAGKGEINGDDFANSLMTDDSGREGTFGFNLSRDYQRVTGVLGIHDQSSPSCTGVVELTGDGRSLGQSPYELSFGQDVPVELSVDDILRLQVNYSSGRNCQIVFGDFQVAGLRPNGQASATPSASDY